MSARRRRPTVRRVSRDTVLLAAGLAGIGYQQWTGQVIWPLLVVYAGMVGFRGWQALLRVLPGGRELEEEDRPPTSGSSSPRRSRSSSR